MIAIFLIPTSLAQADDLLSPQLDDSIAKGLAFLARQQNVDGSFDGGGPKTAMTGLSVMAFLSAGQAPDVGRHGLVLRNAIAFLIRQVPADGYAGKADGSRMYGHGITTLALAEALGVETDPRVREQLRLQLTRAVKVILDAQDLSKDAAAAGGWRYEPSSRDSDLSLSGWNALALRAAQNVGVAVPKERVDRAAAYVLRCWRADQKGFVYQADREATAAMTGVGMLNLYLLGLGDRAELPIAATFLMKHPVNDSTRFPYYAMYYTTQAAFQAGGDTWPAVWKPTQQALQSSQITQDGGWPASRTSEEPGRVYATAMAVLTLSVPYRVLPVYQR